MRILLAPIWGLKVCSEIDMSLQGPDMFKIADLGGYSSGEICASEREFSIDDLLVQIHYIVVMFR